jgi:hypothetical protein
MWTGSGKAVVDGLKSATRKIDTKWCPGNPDNFANDTSTVYPGGKGERKVKPRVFPREMNHPKCWIK